jgi:hypothetical protein
MCKFCTVYILDHQKENCLRCLAPTQTSGLTGCVSAIPAISIMPSSDHPLHAASSVLYVILCVRILTSGIQECSRRAERAKGIRRPRRPCPAHVTVIWKSVKGAEHVLTIRLTQSCKLQPTTYRHCRRIRQSRETRYTQWPLPDGREQGPNQRGCHVSARPDRHHCAALL